jgi:hypothetical protein
MSLIAAPFGIKPFLSDGVYVRESAYKNVIADGYANNIYCGEPVMLNVATQQIEAVNANATNTVALAKCLGAFAGVEYFDVSGKKNVDNKWIGGTKLMPGKEVIVYVHESQGGLMQFAVQAAGSLPANSVGKQANFAALTAGNVVTGQSQASLSTTLQAAAAFGHFLILGAVDYPDNDFGDAFTIVRGLIVSPQFGAPLAAAV